MPSFSQVGSQHSDPERLAPQSVVEALKKAAAVQPSHLAAKTDDGEEPEEFLSIVGPLELSAEAPLEDPARGLCLRAFLEHPDGFRRVAGKAHRRSTVNPVGLLIHLVRKREHLFIPGARQFAEDIEF